MFSLVSGVYQAYLAPTQLNILVVGASGSGKTTMMERIKVTMFANKISNTPPPPPQQQQRNKRVSNDGGEPNPNVPTHWLKPINNNDNHKVVEEEAMMENGNASHRQHQEQQQQQQQQNQSTTNTSKGQPPPKPPFTLSSQQEMAASNSIKKKARSSWLCPSPSRYADACKSDDNEEDLDVPLTPPPQSPAELTGTVPSAMPTRNVRKTTSSSMESVELAVTKVATCCIDSSIKNKGMPDDDDDEGDDDNTTAARAFVSGGVTATSFSSSSLLPADTTTTTTTTTILSLASSIPPVMADVDAELAEAEMAAFTESKEYDLKPNAKMLSLNKIRRTVGMNLSKLQIQGVVCHFWDLGGRMHELWERYYFDSDAVIFVWKTPLGADDNHGQGDDKDGDNKATIDAAVQQSLLEEVRSSIPDDVPFLVLGHLFRDPSQKPPSSSNRCYSRPKTDICYNTNRLLPNYHNPYQALFFANAATGKGVKSALEWLVPLAKRQLKSRESRLFEGVANK